MALPASDLVGSPEQYPRSPARSESSASTFRSPTGSEVNSGTFRSPTGSEVNSSSFRSPTTSESNASIFRSPTGSESNHLSRTSSRSDVSNGSTFRVGAEQSTTGRRRSSNGQAPMPVRIRRTSSSNGKGDGKPSILTLPDGSADERVKVYVRVRPITTAFQNVGLDEEAVRPAIRADPENKQVTVFDEKDVQAGRASMQRAFEFDGVFPPDSSQAELFEAVGQPVLDAVLAGYDGTILAYGQTGSGKTHSLLNPGDGDLQQAGLVSRLAGQLFMRIAADRKNSYSVQLAFCQIYNETISDLLSAEISGTPLRLRETRSADGVRGGACDVEGLTWLACRSPTELLQHFNRGKQGLHYAETKLNRHSSRAHAVLQIRVVRKAAVDAVGGELSSQRQRVDGKVECEVRSAQLLVVDMAGSERVKRAGSEGLRMKEAMNINTSLLCFGNVVSALAARQKHVPFRDSKLTRLLEKCVGGRCPTSLLVCVSPSLDDAPESLGSLELGSRAMGVKVVAEQNRGTVFMDAEALAQDLAQTFRDSAIFANSERVAVLEDQLKEARHKAKGEANLEAEKFKSLIKAEREHGVEQRERARKAEEAEAKASERARAQEARAKAAEARAHEAEERAAVAVSAHMGTEERVRAAEAQVTKLTETVEQLRKALKEEEAQAKEWNERYNAMAQTAALSAKEAEEAQQASSSLEEQRAAVDSRCWAAEEKIDGLQKWCTELEAEVDSGRVKGEKAQQDMEAAAKRREEMQARIRELTANVTTCEEKNKELRGKLKGAEKKLAASEKERASLESRTAALETASTDAAQLKEWVVRAQKLEEQTTDLRSSHAGALLQLASSQDHEIRLEKDLSASRVREQDLKVALNEARATAAASETDHLLARALQGTVCTKYGRNGKPYRRLVRLCKLPSASSAIAPEAHGRTPEVARFGLQWAPVGEFRAPLSLQGGALCGDRGGKMGGEAQVNLATQERGVLTLGLAGEAEQGMWKRVLKRVLSEKGGQEEQSPG